MPVNLLLVRDDVGPVCTFGTLRIGDAVFHTIERPWIPDPRSKCGRKGVSCVPPGTYELRKHSSETHPRVFALVSHDLGVYHTPRDVPRGAELVTRTAVLIHAANWAHELRGCIAPGMSRGSQMVLLSRQAMRRIREVLPWKNEHTLEIRYSIGVSFG